MRDVLKALDFTFRKDIEGENYRGNHAFDPNPTRFGVTLKTLQDLGASMDLDLDNDGDVDVDDLWLMPKETAALIAHKRYWVPAGCPDLPLPVAIAHFDLAYNAGPKTAIVVLQLALGFKGSMADGLFGPYTKGAVRRTFPNALAHDQLWARLQFYYRLVVNNRAKLPALPHWVYRTAELRTYLTTL